MDTLSLTDRVARFAGGLRLDAVPDGIRRKTALHILDTVGCGIAGAGSDLGERVLRFLAIEGGGGPCPVLGTSRSFGPATAAFANAAAMNALDCDDGFEVEGKGMGHPGATIVAAAASAPFLGPVTGAEFLAAIVAGYEVNHRLILAMQPTLERFRQVYGVCQHQSVGASIAFGRLAGLDAEALHGAMGFAGTLTSVPSLRKYNWAERPLISLKDFNAPAAEAGARGVQLQRCGLVGSREILDGETGLWRMLGSDRFDGDLLLAGLGERWWIAQSSFKRYPACRWMHAALAAFETLLRESAIAPDTIREVVVHTSAALARDFMQRDPQTMVDAQFSFPFALAALACGIAPAAAWYVPETFGRADIRAFAGRVRARVDPEVERLMGGATRRPAGRVTVVTEQGAFASPLVEFAPGSRENPMDEAEIVEKFRANADPVIGGTTARELAERLLDLEREGDVAALLALAIPQARGS